MQIYHYSPNTGEYLGAETARESPREPGKFLIPANATTIAPLQPGVKQAAVFANNAWTLVPDHRGERWYQADGSEVDIADLNVVPDASWAETAPPPSAEQLHRELVDQAKTALGATDMVALRCFKMAVVFPVEWQAYTFALRNIVNGVDTTSTSLPAQPAYPAGT